MTQQNVPKRETTTRNMRGMQFYVNPQGGGYVWANMILRRSRSAFPPNWRSVATRAQATHWPSGSSSAFSSWSSYFGIVNLCLGYVKSTQTIAKTAPLLADVTDRLHPRVIFVTWVCLLLVAIAGQVLKETLGEALVQASLAFESRFWVGVGFPRSFAQGPTMATLLRGLAQWPCESCQPRLNQLGRLLRVIPSKVRNPLSNCTPFIEQPGLIFRRFAFGPLAEECSGWHCCGPGRWQDLVCQRWGVGSGGQGNAGTIRACRQMAFSRQKSQIFFIPLFVEDRRCGR